MKRLYIERVDLNKADDEYPMTVRIVLQMKDHVDGLLLEEAVSAAQTRYPYLCVKLGVECDDDGSEHYVYHDNPRPWKVTGSRQPVCLCSEEANEHLMAFSWWDDCVALDFFHALIDGIAAYRILRTLLYEYCLRRYDSELDPTGVWKTGDIIDEAEWTDPATLPRPASIHPQQLPEFPKVINLATDAIVPLADKKEVIQICISEEQIMKRVRACGATPTSFLSLILARTIARLHPESAPLTPTVIVAAIARLHPESAPLTPTVIVAVDLRKALGTTAAHHSQVGGLFLPLGQDMQQADFETQVAAFRRLIADQTYPDNLQDYFWQTQDRMERVCLQYASCVFSYVGKAHLGAAERYVKEMRTETDSSFMVVVEVSAAAGVFCISFMQRFTTDVYLDTFLDELHQQGLAYEISDRHPLQIAPIADYRNTKVNGKSPDPRCHFLEQ